MSRFLTASVVFALMAATGCGRSAPAPSAPATAAGPVQDSEGDLKWAKEISEAFLVAAKHKQARQASLLLSAEMRDSLRGTAAGDAPTYLSNTFGNWKLDSWSYKAERLSPDKNEASFHGILKSREYGEADFVLRVVKEKDSGLWRVSFLSDGDWKAVAADKSK